MTSTKSSPMTEGTTMPAEREAIVRIAKGLTEAQRRAIAADDLDLLTHGQFKKLCLTGCAWYRAADIDLETGHLSHTRRQLRSKGIALRDHLKESTHE